MFKHTKNMKKYYKLLSLSVACLCSMSAQAAEEQFNDALRAANTGNIGQLQQYQSAMQNDALGYYPEYWILNQNLGSQPASQIISFAQRYPQSAMAEKLAADYVEEKSKWLTLPLHNLYYNMSPMPIRLKPVQLHKSVLKVAISWFMLNLRMSG